MLCFSGKQIAKSEVRVYLLLSWGGVGCRLPRNTVWEGRRTVTIEFCAFMCIYTEKLSVQQIIMEDHRQLCKSRKFSVLMHVGTDVVDV